MNGARVKALGSESQLAQDLGVSQGTVRKAINDLAALNLVVRRQGRGTFVAEHSNERDLYHYFKLVDDRGRIGEPDTQTLEITNGRADSEESDKLSLQIGDRVTRLQRVRSLDGVRSINEQITVPAARFPQLAKITDIPNAIYEYFQVEYGISVVRVLETVTPVLSDAADKERLGVKLRTPLLRIDRVSFTFDDTPVEYRISRCVADVFKYQVELF